VTRARPDRGDHAISRKAIAQGMSDVLRCPVCSCAALFALIAHETADAARIRHSLRPLNFEGEEFQANLGWNAPRECEATFPLSSPSLPPPLKLQRASTTKPLDAPKSTSGRRRLA
jgi:hypothetical protein